jgi:four helix bundle protein
MKILQFEDLDVWREARSLTKEIYQRTMANGFSSDYGLKDQMRRAGVSIMANIAEGFSRKGDKEFSHFLFLAKGSASELQSHAYVALDQNYISDGEFKDMYESLDHLSRMLSNFIKHLSSRTTRSASSTQ